MAKSHKHAADGVDIHTALTLEQVRSLAAAAAARSRGDVWNGAQRVRLESESSSGQVYTIVNAPLPRASMTFSMQLKDAGTYRSLSTSIDSYVTSQVKVEFFIPVSPKKMVAHHTYKQFVESLAAHVLEADPSAEVAFRGSVGYATGSAAEAGAPAVVSAYGEPPLDAGEKPAVAAEVSAVSPGGRLLPPPPPPPGPAVATASAAPPLTTSLPTVEATPEPVAAISAALPSPPEWRAPKEEPAATTGAESGLIEVPAFLSGMVTPAPPAPVDRAPVAEFAPVVPHWESNEPVGAPTISVPLAPGSWILTLLDGSTIDVGVSGVLLGRDPKPLSTHPNAQVVTVIDEPTTISKTHAIFDIVDGGLGVTDLGSTNGTVLIHADGHETDLLPGQRVALSVGATIEIGSYLVTVSH